MLTMLIVVVCFTSIPHADSVLILQILATYAGIVANIQDTNTYPKCYVGKNGKQNQQKYTYKCVDHSMLLYCTSYKFSEVQISYAYR